MLVIFYYLLIVAFPDERSWCKEPSQALSFHWARPYPTIRFSSFIVSDKGDKKMNVVVWMNFLSDFFHHWHSEML